MDDNKFFVWVSIALIIGFILIISFAKMTEIPRVEENIPKQTTSINEQISPKHNSKSTVKSTEEVNVQAIGNATSSPQYYSANLMASIPNETIDLRTASEEVDLRTTTVQEETEEETIDLTTSNEPQDIRREDLSQYTYFDVIWTSYDLCVECCGKTPNDPYFGVTASGYKITPGIGDKVIAVDPGLIPLGSKVYVEILDDTIDDYGYAIAADTGSAINGYHIDLYVDGHSGQWYGKGNARVYIIE